MRMKRTSCVSKCCEHIITPSLEKVGWVRCSQISFYEDADFVYKHLNAEYVLYYKPNIPVAVISVTDHNTNLEMGLKTAINNAVQLDIPCAFSTNGSGFIFYNRTKLSDYAISNRSIDKFPTPQELWQIYITYKNVNVITSEIKSADNNGFARLLVGLLNVGASIGSILFRVLDTLFCTSTDKRVLYLTDHNSCAENDCCWHNEEKRKYKIQEDWKIVENCPYPQAIENVWVNNIGNISVCRASMNEFVGLDKSHTYEQYPSDFFDMIFIDINKREIMKFEHYQRILDHFTGALQVAIKPQYDITKFDIEYFGEPRMINIMEPADREHTEYDLISEAYNQPHRNDHDVVSQQCTSNTNKTFKNNSNTISAKNVINNKITINTTVMARQTSFEHQIELAEDLKSYLIRLQEHLANAAQKYHDKADSLYEAGMMDEKHKVLEEYMFETSSRIKGVVEQINESDIPFVNSWISYLEEGQSVN